MFSLSLSLLLSLPPVLSLCEQHDRAQRVGCVLLQNLGLGEQAFREFRRSAPYGFLCTGFVDSSVFSSKDKAIRRKKQIPVLFVQGVSLF